MPELLPLWINLAPAPLNFWGPTRGLGNRGTRPFISGEQVKTWREQGNKGNIKKSKFWFREYADLIQGNRNPRPLPSPPHPPPPGGPHLYRQCFGFPDWYVNGFRITTTLFPYGDVLWLHLSHISLSLRSTPKCSNTFIEQELSYKRICTLSNLKTAVGLFTYADTWPHYLGHKANSAV